MTQVSISELFVASAGAMAKLFLLSLVGVVFAKYPSGAPVLNPTAQRSLAQVCLLWKHVCLQGYL